VKVIDFHLNLAYFNQAEIENPGSHPQTRRRKQGNSGEKGCVGNGFRDFAE
jgi:hypothetical protein